MRSIEEIYQAMLETISERSGFSPAEDCDLAVRLYAAAAQVQALELQADWVLDQSFPQTAQGVYLERHAARRGLSLRPRRECHIPAPERDNRTAGKHCH